MAAAGLEGTAGGCLEELGRARQAAAFLLACGTPGSAPQLQRLCPDLSTEQVGRGLCAWGGRGGGDSGQPWLPSRACPDRPRAFLPQRSIVL
jgi:hypothetical protein